MRYEFSGCVLDTERCELRRGGEIIGVRRKVLQVLTYLIEHHDRVVPKQELFDAVWKGRVVGDATLNSCLKEARRAIGDNGREQRLLKTRHGHGYHFVAPLRRDTEPPPVRPSPVPAGRAEREYKQVSLLACEVQNAGELAGRMEAEELDSLMREFLTRVRVVLERYGGTEIEHQGAGFTALFGAPAAFEDHARRAALAALDLQHDGVAAGRELRPTLRIGLHTGRVVVGPREDGEQVFTATGDAVRIAHRIMQHSDAAILASATFFSLVESDFRASPQTVPGNGQHDLPGLFAIRAEAQLHGGVPRTARKRSRFVGRGDEMRIVQSRFDLAASGNGQVVCISGEPGIGKSRLLDEFLATVDAGQASVLNANCLAYRRSSPYFPLTQLLQQLPGAAGGIEFLTGATDAGAPEGSAAPPEAPRASRAQVFASANRMILEGSRGAPSVVAIEDLHWIDSSSEEWLATLVPAVSGALLLLVMTYRPGFQATWLSHSFVTQLALPRLNDADSADLVASLDNAPAANPEARRRIVGNAQGNPFFLEELAFNLASRESGDSRVVPTTVESVLAQRIDELLPNDKQLLQRAAVIGIRVDHELLQASAGRPEEDIGASIGRLEASEFLHADRASDRRRYLFKHALTRDVAYGSMLSGARRELHRRIAVACERHFAEVTRSQPEILAHHLDEAGDHGKAMQYWRDAGDRAVRQSANPEAVTHFERALAASERVPSSDEIRKQQLGLYLSLGPPLMSSKAFTSPAVEAAYLKARQLCHETGSSSELLTVLWGLWLHYAHRGRINDARPLARQIVAMADDIDDDGLVLQAHHAAWTTEIWHGELQLCEEHARAGMRLYDRDRHSAHRYLFGGHDPGVCAFGTAGICAWFRGRADEALWLTQQGADLATTIDHPYSRIITLFDFMEVEALRGNPESSGRYAQIALRECAEQQVPNYHAVATIFAGCSVAYAGEVERGMRQMKEGLEQYRALGAERLLAPYLLMLAEHCATPAYSGEGLAAVDQAAELVRRTGEVRWEPEVARMRGNLLLAESAGNEEQALTLFDEARQCAATQGCLAFELRAATGFAELLHRRGNSASARNALAPVLSRFSEGFKTRDLRRAGRLLDNLD